MGELVDPPDLKSCGPNGPCEFESHLRYINSTFMKKILFIIGMFFCSCADNITPTQVNAEIVNAEIVRVTLPNGCYSDYVKFTYEGHEYLTDYQSKIFYHLPSCPCHQPQLKNILDYE